MRKKNSIELILTALVITVITGLGIILVLRVRGRGPPEEPSFEYTSGKPTELSNYNTPGEVIESRTYEYSIDSTEKRFEKKEED